MPAISAVLLLLVGTVLLIDRVEGAEEEKEEDAGKEDVGVDNSDDDSGSEAVNVEVIDVDISDCVLIVENKVGIGGKMTVDVVIPVRRLCWHGKENRVQFRTRINIGC